MAQHHYLGFRRLVGESLKYVATVNGEWVALLGWGTAAFKCRPRDAWIGWSSEIQWQRLRYIANNMRFLILPWIKVKNLASVILSKNLKRLSSDWQKIHGHPIVLAETFIDHDRFTGACYRACGWLALGQTKGYCRNGGRYYFHGKSKTILVRPLTEEAKALLSSDFLSPELTLKGEEVMDINTLKLDGACGLLEVLKTEIKDPRKRRGIRHRYISILAICICACLSGCRGFVSIAEWAADLSQDILKRFGCRFDDKKGRYIAPSEPTVRRCLQSTDADLLDKVIGNWLSKYCEGEALAIDGKTLRGSSNGKEKGVHLMAALLHKEGVVVSQEAVDSKSNEITANQPLLDKIDIAGKVVTADAMHAQVKHAEYLKERGADYLFVVKGNQADLLDAIKNLDSDDYTDKHETNDKGHGRIEVKKIQSSAILNDYINFPYCSQVFSIERITTDLRGEKKDMKLPTG